MVHHEHASKPERARRFFEFGRDSQGSYRFRNSDLPQQIQLIGLGEIGGKARGLAFVMDHLARGGVLSKHQDLVRFPDSVILTTEVFDDFMQENNLSEAVEAGCTGACALDELQHRMLSSHFPDRWRQPLLDYLARETRPLAVRSSSVMEDDTDHSFAGIYLSDFLSNRGSMEQRLQALIETVLRVYASTFSPNARAYRKRHRLDWRNERMAVLIQNMIGSQYSHGLFYPLVGGVAFSINYYPWTSRLAPEDGIVRLVVGTGTRAVGREFARVFSPRLPSLRPEGSDVQTIIRSSQETVDVLDMERGRLRQTKLNALSNPLLTKICSIVGDHETLHEPLSSAALVGSDHRLVASFTRLIESQSLMPFTPLVRQTLSSLETLMDHPVDMEFAVEFSGPEVSAVGSPLFYILQVRPLGMRPEHREVAIPDIPDTIKAVECSHVLGNGYLEGIRHLVFVDPETYRWDHAHSIARAVGQINQHLDGENEPYVLIGPGRWGSSNPQLGVPAQYSEISGAAVIVEMSTASFSPELSYGTHFYADMVASGVLYLPLYEERGDLLNRELLRTIKLVSADAFIRHYVAPDGMTVYVDGQHQRGVIALNGEPIA